MKTGYLIWHLYDLRQFPKFNIFIEENGNDSRNVRVVDSNF